MAQRLSTREQYERFVNLSMVAGVEPVTVDHALGAHLWDVDGREYVDCFAGISVVNAGHCHPHVVAAAQTQAAKLIHCGSYLYEVPAVGSLAEALARVTPGRLQKTFFCNSGAEAVEGALRLARARTGRTEFIALEMSFHGRTSATLGITGNRKRKQHGGPYPSGVAFAPAPHPYRCRYCRGSCTLACADAVEDVIDYQTAGNVAAFIAEPLLGEAGIVVPPPGYFQRVKQILDRHEILFIADEVQTGFGRTGKLFGIEHYGVEPDIMAMAKGIADGFPLGAFIAREEVAGAFQPGEHLSTFGGNPVCCAAGVATLEVLRDEDLPGRARELGEWLGAELNRALGSHPAVGDIRGRGLMVGVEVVSDRAGKTPDPARAARVKAAARQQGLLVGVGGFFGNVVRVQPPLVISQSDLSLAVEVLQGALSGPA